MLLLSQLSLFIKYPCTQEAVKSQIPVLSNIFPNKSELRATAAAFIPNEHLTVQEEKKGLSFSDNATFPLTAPAQYYAYNKLRQAIAQYTSPQQAWDHYSLNLSYAAEVKKHLGSAHQSPPQLRQYYIRY
jgi:hypothetical protein